MLTRDVFGRGAPVHRASVSIPHEWAGVHQTHECDSFVMVLGIWSVYTHSCTSGGGLQKCFSMSVLTMKSALVYLRRTSETSIKLRSIVSSHIAHSGPTAVARCPGKTNQSGQGAGLPSCQRLEVRISSR